MKKCYICFQPTNNQVCTCELANAHRSCILHWILLKGHAKCGGCNKTYKDSVILFVYYFFIKIYWDFCNLFYKLCIMLPPYDLYGNPFELEFSLLEHHLDNMNPLLEARFAAF